MSISTYVAHKRKHKCRAEFETSTPLMDALSDSTDIGDFKIREALPVEVELVNFDKGPRGHCQKRDASVLGRCPGITIPESLCAADNILVSFYLHHDITKSSMGMYLGKDARGQDRFKPPVFLKDMDQQLDRRVRVEIPVQSNQQWIGPGHKQVHWHKKKWTLSGHMRKISETKFPHWVIVLTPMANGLLQHAKSVRSPPYEVRSKDQPKDSAFANGRTVAKRRTPETFRAEQTLKSEQADILKLTDSIRTKSQQHDECKTRLDFALAIVKSDPGCAHLILEIEKYMRFHKM